jgi:ubiquitin-protein ligase
MSANRIDRINRIMFHQLEAADKADHPNIMVYMDESDVKRWFFLVTNLPGPYAGGEYIFRLTAPVTFPQQPPEFQFLTPNGVFELGGKICISIGEFHATDAAGKTGAYGWRSALGMIGFAREVVNGMIAPDYLGGGIRVRNDPPAVKARHAAASEAYNREHHAELMGRFSDFETAHPERTVVRFRQMWRAATAAAATDFAAVMLESLPPLFADAFGPEAWRVLAGSLGRVAEIPDVPLDRLVPMGFRVNGRALILLVADRLREALAEREPAVRHALVLALHARILWEVAGDPAQNPDGRGPWVALFREAYAGFLAVLPGVCGGACRESVPDATAKVGAAPSAFPRLHADLARFLRTQDIDDKARLGKIFAARALAEAAEAPAEPEAESKDDGTGAAAAQVAALSLEAGGGAPAPPPADAVGDQDGGGSLDDYVAGLLDDL